MFEKRFMMAILITYPKEKVPVYWRQKLADLTEVVYFPFRVLLPKKLNAEEKITIQNAESLAITSQFGALVFGQQFSKLNQQAILYVLSQKIKKRLLTYKIKNPVIVSASENRDSLLKILRNADASSLCWLIGDKAEKYYSDFPGKKIIIYQNSWDQAHEKKAEKILSEQSISEVLVTSSSNFDRFQQAMEQIQTNKYEKMTYYVLGPSTGSYLKNKGLEVVYPQGKTEVLDQALRQIYIHEKDNKSREM